MKKVKFLATISYKEIPTLEEVNKRYPGVPVVALSSGWVLFSSLEDFYDWFNSTHKIKLNK